MQARVSARSGDAHEGMLVDDHVLFREEISIILKNLMGAIAPILSALPIGWCGATDHGRDESGQRRQEVPGRAAAMLNSLVNALESAARRSFQLCLFEWSID